MPWFRNSHTGKTNDTRVDANDISDGVASYIDDLPEYVTFNGDRNLSNKLDFVVQFANVKDVTGGFMGKTLRAIRGGKLQNEMENAVGATEDIEIGNIGKSEVLLVAESESTVRIDDAKAVQLYVASGVVGGDALNSLVADAIEKTIKSYVHTVRGVNVDIDWVRQHPTVDWVDSIEGIYDHDYTVSVSTSSKSVNGAEATFVAVQVVRESNHH